MSKEHTIGEMQALARGRGGECLSTSFYSTAKKLKWRCSEGHEWEAIPKNMLSKGTWCPFCSGKAQLSIDEMQAIAKERGGECLSSTYSNGHKKLKWRCSEGHIFEATPSHVRHSGSWCRTCAAGRGESFCRIAFETIFGGAFPNKRPNWLISSRGTKLELDGYNREIGLAFEHQGKQHYEPKDFQTHRASKTSKTALRRTQANDLEKLELCVKKGVTLILVPEVPSLTKLENLKDTIGLLCRKAGFILPDNFDRIEVNYMMAYASPETTKYFEEFRQIAAERGGRLISPFYKGSNEAHRWQCEKGHLWWAKPINIKHRGSWCPVCAAQINAAKLRFNLEDIQDFAKKHGGKCLSHSYKSIMDRLDWQCAKGHEWTASPNNVLRGTWCPYCAGKKISIETIKDIAVERGGKCLSEKYVNLRTKLEWQCREGHTWMATLGAVRNRGSWCPICRKKNNV
ncbi:zinc-ribbon domain-containing protein [Akkermansiaceae bacterium]|nr:zinc-ribbon domain-containing protein [Akkermansiaceae bacterium]